MFDAISAGVDNLVDFYHAFRDEDPIPTTQVLDVVTRDHALPDGTKYEMFPDALYTMPSGSDLAKVSPLGALTVAARDAITQIDQVDWDIGFLESAANFGERVGVAWDYVTGEYTLPKPVPPGKTTPTEIPYLSTALTDRQKSMLLGLVVASPGLKSSLLKPAIAVHLLTDALSTHLDFRRGGRQAYEGIPALLEPYLMMGMLALGNSGASLWTRLQKSLQR